MLLFLERPEVLNCTGLSLSFSMQLPDPSRSMRPRCAARGADSRARWLQWKECRKLVCITGWEFAAGTLQKQAPNSSLLCFPASLAKAGTHCFTQGQYDIGGTDWAISFWQTMLSYQLTFTWRGKLYFGTGTLKDCQDLRGNLLFGMLWALRLCGRSDRVTSVSKERSVRSGHYKKGHRSGLSLPSDAFSISSHWPTIPTSF